MREFKYEIGDTLYRSGCSTEYKKTHPLTVMKRKMDTKTTEIEGEKIEISIQMYAFDASRFNGVWYPASTLTSKL